MNHIVLVSVSSLSLLCMCMCVCVTHFASIGVRGGGAELDNNDVKVLCQLCTVLCTRTSNTGQNLKGDLLIRQKHFTELCVSFLLKLCVLLSTYWCS